MIAHFYRYHQTITADVVGKLEDYEIDREEKEELAGVIKETLANHLLRVLLDHFPKEVHEELVLVFKSGKKPVLSVEPAQLRSDIHQIVADEMERVKKEIVAEIRKAARKK